VYRRSGLMGVPHAYRLHTSPLSSSSSKQDNPIIPLFAVDRCGRRNMQAGVNERRTYCVSLLFSTAQSDGLASKCTCTYK